MTGTQRHIRPAQPREAGGCACVGHGGRVLCREGSALRYAVEDAYNQACRDGDWAAYEAAVLGYQAHIKSPVRMSLNGRVQP